MKFTIISGNPIDGYECYGVFDSRGDAIDWANSYLHFPDEWNVMIIHSLGD